MQADLHFVSLGLTYRFGQTKQPVMVAAPLVPAVIPVPSVTTKVVLNGQALFGFDSDVVQSSEELTALVQKAVDVNNGALMITGHTDNLGQAEYNQKLSEKGRKRWRAISMLMGSTRHVQASLGLVKQCQLPRIQIL